MKKQAFLRFILGALGGVLVAQIVLIIISLCIGQGEVMPVPPALFAQVGNELSAYILQTLAVMLYGGVWAAASLVWEKDWSLLKQTVVHCLCCSLSALPIATLLHWFPHTPLGFAGYFGGFLLLYFSMWLSQYLQMRARVRRMNQQLHTR